MQRKIILLSNQLGLHARASAKVVNLAARFASEIYLVRDGRKANARSILDVMKLAASHGTQLELVVKGTDEVEALAAMEKLIHDKFGEDK
jgi:phosphocarrier protein